MKKMILVAIAAAVAMTSCEQYEGGRPQQDVKKEFNRMYPDAFDVEWDWEGTHWDVSFETGSRPNGIEHEASYSTDGTWMYTKTEMHLTAVPQQIKDYLAADPTYGTMAFADNDADYFQTPSGNFYRFSLRDIPRETEVDVTESGEITLADYTIM